jgi:NAD-dependent DNA ligase
MDKKIKKLINILLNPETDIFIYASKLEINDLENIILYASDKYYNTTKSIISDKIYDILIDILKVKNPNSSILKNIGAPINTNNKTKLDYWLGSMNKIKPNNNNDLTIWTNSYKPPYNISDKLDGVSALLIYNNNSINMFTRGDGNIGSNITPLLNYMESIPLYTTIYNYCKINNINGQKNLLALRGELIINKNIFLDKWATKFKNPRSTVAGIVNSKKINIKLAQDIELVLYEVVDPIFPILKQFKIIKELNFNLVYNITINNIINYNYLSNYLLDRRQKSIYQSDGIIVSTTAHYNRNLDGNPHYAFAYKDILEDQIANAIVDHIEWNISKDGYIIPTVILNPITISGVIIKRTAGFNAKFIVDNNLGPGAELEIIRSGDVIPYIKKIIKQSTLGKPELPKIKWHWTKTNIDIQIDNIETNQEVQIKNLYHFFSILKTKGLGQKNIEKLYAAGFTTVNKILEANPNDLLTVSNFGEKMVKNLLNELKQVLNNLSLSKLMAASNKLGHGLGEERIKQIIYFYPNILLDYKKWTYQEFINNIIKINGWDIKTATLFVTNFPEFIKFFNLIKKYIKLKTNTEIETQDKFFTNKILVFSGFRDKDLQEQLEKQGAKIITTITKNVDYLVIKNKDILNNPTDKILKANKYNINIITKDQLLNNFFS